MLPLAACIMLNMLFKSQHTSPSSLPCAWNLGLFTLLGMCLNLSLGHSR